MKLTREELSNLEIDQLENIIIDLQEDLQKLRPFLHHKSNCTLNKQRIMTNAPVAIPCNCGYGELIGRIFY